MLCLAESVGYLWQTLLHMDYVTGGDCFKGSLTAQHQPQQGQWQDYAISLWQFHT